MRLKATQKRGGIENEEYTLKKSCDLVNCKVFVIWRHICIEQPRE